MTTAEEKRSLDFIRQIVADDVARGRNGGRVVTRFPPEPNGYLHVGHAMAISIDFGVATEFGGRTHLRFDDTNPVKEEQEYIDSIKEDIRWLGYDWGAHEYYASDYFQQLHDWAVTLIEEGKAYVDDLNAEQIREFRGTLTAPGRESPFRGRSVEENLDLFARMKAGEFPNGAKVLRAKIDMASPNINLRDPVMYRILHAAHHRTGDAWCIYPTYDWAHGQSDAIEGITHSICTLEFEDHRPLYDWCLDRVGIRPDGERARPRQIEFARLNFNYTVMSKRKLLQLVDQGHVDGWDDPRMPTISGMRRRGYPPDAIRATCTKAGVAKREKVNDIALLEHSVREALNRTAPRFMAVLDPVKVIIENWPQGKVDELDAVNNPEDPAAGTRIVPFSREIYIEREDFMEDAPRKFFRLSPGREVRLRWAYFITCTGVEKDASGRITTIRGTHDPATRGGDSPDGRKVKGTIHWVSADHAFDAEVRLYDRLFSVENPNKPPTEGGTFLDNINSESLRIITGKLEPGLARVGAGERVQFERIGYFCVDTKHSTPGRPVFNRTVALRDSWARAQQQEGQS